MSAPGSAPRLRVPSTHLVVAILLRRGRRLAVLLSAIVVVVVVVVRRLRARRLLVSVTLLWWSGSSASARAASSQCKLTGRHTAVVADIPVAEARHIVVAAGARRSCCRGTAVPGSTTWRMGRRGVSRVRSDGCTRVQRTEPRRKMDCLRSGAVRSSRGGVEVRRTRPAAGIRQKLEAELVPYSHCG
jgi:hypothetical protein